jgi:hypothetical protein
MEKSILTAFLTGSSRAHRHLTAKAKPEACSWRFSKETAIAKAEQQK